MHLLQISIQLLLLFITAAEGTILRKIKFQYNSCYCLSTAVLLPSVVVTDFNTTLVTVYPNIITIMCVRDNNFNTTLVTVYRMDIGLTSPATQISIQLLLLFIQKRAVINEDVDRFQYNSCYCLSLWKKCL